MAPIPEWLTQKRLKEFLTYNPTTGEFIWVCGQRKGMRAGNLDRYWNICIGGYRITASQLAWLYMTGEVANSIIDHKNLDKSNDSWTNLRKATITQNNHNSATHTYNQTGFKGVRRMKNKYSASIRIDGVRVYLGLYSTPEEASTAYQEAAKHHYGEFAKW